MRYVLMAVILGMCLTAFAESETQTDWAGGPGVQGPVTEWQDKFFIAGDMDWDTTIGQLKLIINRDENQISVEGGPTFVIAVDVDQDGDLDAASCAYNSGEVAWNENTDGLGTSWTRHVIGYVATPRFITVADFDGNGYRDVVVSSDSDDKILLFACGPTGWPVGTDIATGFDARQIRAGDINGDGLTDVVGVSSVSGDVCWWENDGTASSWNQHYIDGALMGAYTCDIGDFNGDGHWDVVAASKSHDDIIAYVSQSPYGYSWDKYTIETSYSNPVSVACADYNFDGDDDFAVASASGDGDLRWYDFLDTQSSWVANVMHGAATQTIYDITARDMDADGYPDVVAANFQEDQVVWFKNKEYLGENWETFSVSTDFDGAVGVSTGDMNGDGIPDVLGCAYNGDKISWWRIAGFTTPSAVTSSILDIEPPDPGSVVWEYLYWSATTPADTGIRFRLKTSYSAGTMGPWSVWITSASTLGSLVAQGGQFLQYQAELYTSNPYVTPSLKDMTVLWNPVSIDDEGSAPLDGRRVWLVSGNPVEGAFSIGYHVEQSGYVDIAVYDVTGRKVFVVNEGNLASGQYSGMVTSLPAGSYAVVMQTEGETAAQRVVVIR